VAGQMFTVDVREVGEAVRAGRCSLGMAAYEWRKVLAARPGRDVLLELVPAALWYSLHLQDLGPLRDEDVGALVHSVIEVMGADDEALGRALAESFRISPRLASPPWLDAMTTIYVCCLADHDGTAEGAEDRWRSLLPAIGAFAELPATGGWAAGARRRVAARVHATLNRDADDVDDKQWYGDQLAAIEALPETDPFKRILNNAHQKMASLGQTHATGQRRNGPAVSTSGPPAPAVAGAQGVHGAYEDGDALFLSVKRGSRMGRAISAIDRAKRDGISVSHTGLIAHDANGTLRFVEMSGEHKSLQARLADEGIGGRAAFRFRHARGAEAARAGRAAMPKIVRYSMEHLILAGIAAALRSRGVGEPNRDRLWEYIHLVSRDRCGVRNCEHSVLADHLVALNELPNCTCAALVDHLFRAGQVCLHVEEPAGSDNLGLTVAGIVRLLRQIVRARWAEPEEVPSAAVLALPVVRDGLITIDGPLAQAPAVDVGGRDLPPAGPPLDIAPVIGEIFAVELASPDGSLMRALVDEAHSLLALLLDELIWLLERTGVIPTPDGHVAPQPGEPMWPPFMSLGLLMRALEPDSSVDLIKPKPSPRLR
jgi:hypothetical protein